MSDISQTALAEARSVLAIADHFAKLKERAKQFSEVFSVSDRGYFTPTEDEQVRQLLVSYHRSRSALLDLVLTCHQELDEDGNPARFIAAFAGALVLIDAARFLREEFHQRPVVRAKLNEPEPQFGIEGGTYDQIQKSLTSPVHMWHLYHASKYFEEATDELAQVASKNPLLQEVMDLVRLLRNRMDVATSKLVTTRLRVRARSLRTRIERSVIGRAIYGLQKAISSMMADIYTRPTHTPQLPTGIRDELIAALRPGDVLVTRKEHAATNYFLPGFWPHAALFVGDVDALQSRGLDSHGNIAKHWDELKAIDTTLPCRVVESMKDGVRMRSLATTLKCDAITILRPQMPTNALDDVVARAFFHVGKDYDFDFDFARADRMVCTEVVYRSYDGIEGTSFELKKRAGRLTLAAEDIMRMALADNAFRVEACFSPTHTSDLLRGAAAADLVADTIGPA